MSSLLLRIGSYDERLLRALMARRRPVLDVLMQAITRFADWPVAVLLALLMLGGFVPGLDEVGVRIAWTLGISHAFVQILKRIFSRARPRFEPGLSWLVAVPDRFSFPSGHATAAMSIALPLAIAVPGVAGPLVLILGVLVGLSRCYLGVHYPGDIAAGWALAVTTLAGVVVFGF